MARKRTDIRLVVRAEVEKAIRKLEKTEHGIDKMSKSGGRAAPVFSKLGGVVGGFIAALSIRQIVNFTLEMTKLADSAEQAWLNGRVSSIRRNPSTQVAAVHVEVDDALRLLQALSKRQA